MHRRALELLRDPHTHAPLSLESPVVGEEIGEGELVAANGARYPIRQSIPRFVEGLSYTNSFGDQWTRYRRTQLDGVNGTTLSRDRLFQGTEWPASLAGQRILEVGCGAGRFTEILLATGAEVWAVDASRAVEACWDNHGSNPRLTVVQADVFALPFGPDSFDRVLCYGMLQHTPDVPRACASLARVLKPGGILAIDMYRKFTGLRRFNRWTSKYWWRPITKRLPPARLASFVEWYVPRWMPVDTALQRVPVLGQMVSSVVPCWNYTGMLPLTAEQLKEWAVLDTFDALASWHDSPATPAQLTGWLVSSGLRNVHVRLGGNGLLGNASK